MGMPVKLSDDLVRKARSEAGRARRSMTAQVEYWARIGRAAERSLPPTLVEKLALGQTADVQHPMVSFFEHLVASGMESAARQKLALTRHPRYETDPAGGGMLIEIREDGRRVRGRWDMKRNRFVPARRSRRTR